VEHYRANRSGQGVSRIVMQLEAWMHRELARRPAETILEIGAGNLNHVPYHPAARAYDVVEPFRELSAEVEVARFPVPWHHLSFYTVASAVSPRLDRCRGWSVRHPGVVQ
jgi:hypothetical protein